MIIDSSYRSGIQISLDEVQDAQIEGELKERFEQAMSSVESHDGLEGQLFKNVSELKSNIDNAKIALQDNMQAIGDNPAKLLEMQWAITRITFQEELIAKTVGKTTQNVETLLKAQ